MARTQGVSVPQDVRDGILHDWRFSDLSGGKIAEKWNVSSSYPTTLARRHGATRKFTAQQIALKHGTAGKNGPPRKAEPPALMNRAHHKASAPAPEKKPQPEAMVRTINVAEVKRLFAKNIGRTRIAAMMRLPYAEIDRALAT